jgi:DNA-binding beta-propeller fold protein YncE
VSLYLQGIVGIRPMIDLSSYHLLILNQDASISVVDPIVSMTGKTSLFTTIRLHKPGADWTKSANDRRIYVSMPRAGQVAVVDAERFRVLETVEAGADPTRVALQPDGRYLWVGNDARDAARSGVTVIDTQTLATVARIATGRGHHEIAFSGDDRHAFVTNRNDGTVSVIDVARLRKVKDLRTGPVPISIAWSPLSRAIYVADGSDGRIAEIDADRLEIVRHVSAKPGLGPMRFSPDGRWGVAVNPTEHAAFVVDASDATLAQTIPLEGAPYQVTFSRAFAYVRHLDDAKMSLVHLDSLGAGKKPVVQVIGLGTGAPKAVPDLSIADAIYPASTETSVFATNPADNSTYFYMEGMNAPSGSFGSYGHAARAAMVVDRSLREIEPGVYAGDLRIPASGSYDVAFILDTPRVVQCFRAEAKANPTIVRDTRAVASELLRGAPVFAGERHALRVKLTEPATGGPHRNLEDVRILYYVAPGEQRTELAARHVGDGVYEAVTTLPRAGAYYVYVSVPSLGASFGDVAFHTMAVRAAKPDAGKEHARAR